MHDPAGHSHLHPHAHPAGHNSRGDAVQWQTPHDPDASLPQEGGEADLDLVEAAFVDGFRKAEDPTSFLRLAGIPFEGQQDGKTLKLLRVESQQITDVASLTPYLGGQEFRHDPLPKALVGERSQLAFCYFDGQDVVNLSFAQARALT